MSERGSEGVGGGDRVCVGCVIPRPPCQTAVGPHRHDRCNHRDLRNNKRGVKQGVCQG